MGQLWTFLAGRPSVEVTVTYGSSLTAEQQRAMSRSADLHKFATQKKRSGDWEGAIECVREADRVRNQAGLGDERSGSMRLAMLLHGAGRKDEAWSEFNRVIVGASLRSTPECTPMGLSGIYDKMRLCLQREGKNADAVGLAMLSYCYWCQGLFLQSRMDEFRSLRSDEVFDKWLLPHLKKAKAIDKLPEFRKLAEESLSQLPAMRGSNIRTKAAALLRK